MKNAGITLILAGIALIGANGLDTAKSKSSSDEFIRAGLAGSQVTTISSFSTISTLLIAVGMCATAVGKKEK